MRSLIHNCHCFSNSVLWVSQFAQPTAYIAHIMWTIIKHITIKILVGSKETYSLEAYLSMVHHFLNFQTLPETMVLQNWTDGIIKLHTHVLHGLEAAEGIIKLHPDPWACGCWPFSIFTRVAQALNARETDQRSNPLTQHRESNVEETEGGNE